MRRRILALVSAALMSGLTACSYSSLYLTDVPQAMLDTPGTRIVADDGSFTFDTGMTLNTPFQAYDCPLQPSTGNYDVAEEWGAKRVTVTVPGRDQTLYGILAFCPIPAEATGPATRLALVQIPQSYVDQTDGGRISVVYEPLQYHYQRTTADRVITNWPAWILYLSQQPFPRSGAVQRGVEGTRGLSGSGTSEERSAPSGSRNLE